MATDLKFYLDVHIPGAVRRYLLRRGADTVAGHEGAGERATDEEHLAAAVAAGRVLVTRDGDFAAFHFAGVRHCGIIVLHRDHRVGDMIEALATVLEASHLADMDGRLEFL